MPASREAGRVPAPSADAGARRGATQARRMSAEPANVTASTASDVRTPKKPTTAPPTPKPRTCANWYVVSVTAVPITYMSPVSTSGKTAARAETNGAPASVTTNSSATRAKRGTLGRAMTSTRPQRTTSQTIITRRRGYLSASQASVTPPTNVGTMLTTNVIAASSADRVLL